MAQELEVVEPNAEESRDLSVVVRNELVRRVQRMKLSEKRLLALAIAKCNPKPKMLLHKAVTPDANGVAPGWVVRVTAQEFMEHYPQIDPKRAYSELKAAAVSLYDCSVEWDTEVTERGKKMPVRKSVRWIYERAELTAVHGWVELKFSPTIAPYLLGLEKSFTKYKLKHAADLRSMYSWRLLEMMAQFRDTGLMVIAYDDFCTAMDAPDSCVKDAGQLKRRVVEPAVKELQEKNGLKIEWTPTKPAGKKITGFTFKFEPDPQGRLF
jgi:plasmid replication initiation protein